MYRVFLLVVFVVCAAFCMCSCVLLDYSGCLAGDRVRIAFLKVCLRAEIMGKEV